MSQTNNHVSNHKLAEYYDKTDIMDEILDESIDLTLDNGLRKDILSGKRRRVCPFEGHYLKSDQWIDLRFHP